MSKQIPIYFDTIIASPVQSVSDKTPNLMRLSVGVFTKYGNRNGSYITEAVANMLIESATKGNTPVVGFFDPETETWASHTGPTLANGYGYVESFEGWQPFIDSDGAQREYAVFSVVLFNDYFKEANLIQGQHQSMELDINSIDGDWADIDGVEFFVYTKAAIQGLCIIGSHEPCFSASNFYSLNNEALEVQYEKFSSLLFELKAQVEEITKNIKGGESPMDEFENQEQQNLEEVQEPEQAIEDSTEFEAQIEETTVETEESVEESVENEENLEPAESQEQEPNEYELLVQKFDALQADFDTLQENYTQAQTRIDELEAAQADFNAQIETLRSENSQLQTSVAAYEAQRIAADEDKKQNLINQYEEILENAEEISVIKENVKNYSYDELESKLAILFAHTQISNNAIPKVPHVEPQESEFALFMKKYRKS